MGWDEMGLGMDGLGWMVWNEMVWDEDGMVWDDLGMGLHVRLLTE
jgi:hypothetical protein